MNFGVMTKPSPTNINLTVDEGARWLRNCLSLGMVADQCILRLPESCFCQPRQRISVLYSLCRLQRLQRIPDNVLTMFTFSTTLPLARKFLQRYHDRRAVTVP